MPTLLSDDPINISEYLASCWNWVIKASLWQAREEEVSKSVDSVEIQHSVELSLAPCYQNGDSPIVLDGAHIIKFCVSQNDTQKKDETTESRRCIVLGVLYAGLVYQKTSEINSLAAVVVKPIGEHKIPCRLHFIFPRTIPASSEHHPLILLLELLWTILDTVEILKLSHDVLAVVCLLSTRFHLLDLVCRYNFLRGIFPWAFYNCLNHNKRPFTTIGGTIQQAHNEGADFCESPSFGLAFLHLLLRLPTSTFINDAETCHINHLCEFVLGTCEGRLSPFLIWLHRQCIPTKDSSASNTVAFHIRISVLLFWRALSWIRVDGVTTDILSHDNSAEEFSPTAVTARQKSVRLVTTMWNFKADVPIGTFECQQYADSERFSFRRFICFLMGRLVIFFLSDVFRVTEMKEILQTLEHQVSARGWSLLDAAERNEECPKPVDGTGELVREKEENHRYLLARDSLILQEKILFQFLADSFALVNNYGTSTKTKDLILQKSIGLSFDVPTPTAPNLQRQIPPPRIVTLLNKGGKRNSRNPSLYLALMMIPPSLELQSMMLEPSILESLSYLSTKADSRTLRHHLHWLITNFSHHKPLDRLLLRLPAIFPFLSQLHSCKKPKVESQQQHQNPSSTKNGSGLITADEHPSLLYNDLFKEPESKTKAKSNSSIEPVKTKPPDFSGIGESGVCHQLFLALEASSSCHPPTAVSRARSALVEVTIFSRLNDSLRMHLELSPDGLAQLIDIGPKTKLQQPETSQDTCLGDTTCPKSESIPETDVSEPPDDEKQYIHESIPNWLICRIVQRSCLDPQASMSTADMISARLFTLTIKDNCDSISPLKANNALSQGSSIHPSLTTLLHILSMSITKWSLQLGQLLRWSLTLTFFEFSVRQLKCSDKLPLIDLQTLSPLPRNQWTRSHIPPTLSNYYVTLCKETLVGRLLILSGIEPQFLLFPPTPVPARGTFWPPNADARKSLRFPLCGLSVLDDLGLSEAPFAHNSFPVHECLVDVLIDAFFLLVIKLPRLWPFERLLPAVTSNLNLT